MSIVDGKIRCPECGLSKTASLEFFEARDLRIKSGYCRQCKRLRKARWYASNKERDQARRNERYRLVKTQEGRDLLDLRRQQRKEGVIQTRALVGRRHSLRKRYGMTEAEYDARVSDQRGRCACCGVGQNIDGRAWCVDHCHKTGEIRGLLCTRCNAGIGNIGDDADSVRRALHYLEKSEKPLLMLAF